MEIMIFIAKLEIAVLLLFLFRAWQLGEFV